MLYSHVNQRGASCVISSRGRQAILVNWSDNIIKRRFTLKKLLAALFAAAFAISSAGAFAAAHAGAQPKDGKKDEMKKDGKKDEMKKDDKAKK